MIPKVRSSMFFGIGKVLGEAQQIIGRHMEKHAKSLNICQTWRILVVFNIGNFSLGHIYGLTSCRDPAAERNRLKQNEENDIINTYQKEKECIEWSVLH